MAGRGEDGGGDAFGMDTAEVRGGDDHCTAGGSAGAGEDAGEI
jgi:hypothetical protein